MKNKIVVIFGPSGSGKSYVSEKLCEDPRFSYVKKATDRARRNNDNSVRHVGGWLYGFDYISEKNIKENDVVFENFGHNYSIDIGDIDRIILHGKTPVIILRTREQIEYLQSLYPGSEIDKFYIRPKKELLVQKLLSDDSRPAKQTQERLQNIDDEYAYHDESLSLDKSIIVLENDYKNPNIVDEIKNSIFNSEILDSSSVPYNLDSSIIFGDKIRISYEQDYANPEKWYWYAKIITADSKKMEFGQFNKLYELLNMLSSIFNKNLGLKISDKFNNSDVAEVAGFIKYISKSIGQYLISFEDLNYEDRGDLKPYAQDITNQHQAFNEELIVSIPSIVLDIEVNHLGFGLKLCTPQICPYLQSEDFDEKGHRKTRFDLVGYEAQTPTLKTKDLTAKELDKIVKELIVKLSDRHFEDDLLPGEYILERATDLCIELVESFRLFQKS